MKTLTLTFILLSYTLFAQLPQFTMLDSLEEGAYGAAAWGDCDNDGDMDLCYISQILPDAAMLVYINNNNVFTQTQQGFPQLYNPAVVWADLNNDGFDDIVVNGADSTITGVTLIYKSNGDATFDSIPNTIPGLSAGSVDVADYNNDNLPDIAVTGMDWVGQEFTYIYKNLGNFTFANSGAQAINGIHFGELQWGDYNHDNLADLVISGRDLDCGTYVYKNMGADSFQLQPFNLKGASGTVDWFDYNEDGWIDILVMGMDSTMVQNFVALYQNNQNGMFTEVATNLPAFGEPNKTAIADLNGDGHNEVLMTGGNANFFNGSAVGIGNGTAQFNSLPFIVNGSILNPNVEAADIDNDGDIDLLWGFYILRNDSPLMGVEEQAPPQPFTIYPQPAYGVLSVKSEKEIQSVALFTTKGQRVCYSTVNNTVAEINIAGLVPGIYIAEIQSGNSVVRKKVLITK